MSQMFGTSTPASQGKAAAAGSARAEAIGEACVPTIGEGLRDGLIVEPKAGASVRGGVGEPLHVTRAQARALKIGFCPLIARKTSEYVTKLRGKRFFGQGLIGADRESVREGFAKLAADGFDRYNFPQVWVERRQIPRVLHKRVPARNAVVLDLGCGPGTSTEVLTYFAHSSWTILGFDLTRAYIDSANARADQGLFRSRTGERIMPRFVCQNIAHELTMDGTPHGPKLATGYADLAIASGVVGLYLTHREAGRLIANLARVVKVGGTIALDAGPSVSARAMERLAARANLELVGTAGSVPLDPRPKLLFKHKLSQG